MEDKTLKFQLELADMIVRGEKTSTWRLFDEKNLQAGDSVVLIRRPELVPFAVAKLVSVIEKPLGSLTNEDKVGHEMFASDAEMYETYTKYYKRPVGPETPVKLIRFELLKGL